MHIGAQLAAKAQTLDDFIASNLMTQVHGDCKGWNLFFKKSDNEVLTDENPVMFIDMQWTGVGHPLQVCLISAWGQFWERVLLKHSCILSIAPKRFPKIVSMVKSDIL